MSCANYFSGQVYWLYPFPREANLATTRDEWVKAGARNVFQEQGHDRKLWMSQKQKEGALEDKGSVVEDYLPWEDTVLSIQQKESGKGMPSPLTKIRCKDSTCVNRLII